MRASELKLKNSLPDLDLNSCLRETSARHASRLQCGPWFSLTPVICVITLVKYVFTALHRMQTRYSDEKAVRPSVCPSVSVCPSNAWQNGRKICPSFYTIRKTI